MGMAVFGVEFLNANSAVSSLCSKHFLAATRFVHEMMDFIYGKADHTVTTPTWSQEQKDQQRQSMILAPPDNSHPLEATLGFWMPNF